MNAGHDPLPSQAEVIGAINDAAGETGVVVCAAGSAPGDLHKLWRARDPKGYHVEYGYSCMGYEIPGAIGVKLAAPEREVFFMVGDGSYLMLPGELVTAVAENVQIVVVLVDNHGYASIGALSRSLGLGRLRHPLPAGANSASCSTRRTAPGPPSRPSRCPWTSPRTPRASARACVRTRTVDELREALEGAKAGAGGPVVVYIETDRYAGVPSYEGWWDVPVAEVSDDPAVQEARSAVRAGARGAARARGHAMSELLVRSPVTPGVRGLGVRGLRGA